MTFASALPYVVFGVTGRTGAAAADALLQSGFAVRVVVRDPATARHWVQRGAEIAVADLTDLAAMTAALSRARGAYVVSPQDYYRDDLFERSETIARTTAQAAVAAGLPKLVALSSVGADLDGGTGWIRMNRIFEQHLGKSGIPSTFLRAAYFMENWTPLLEHAGRSGVLATFLAPPQRRLAMVATEDVGRTAAALLREAWTGNRIVTLSGPDDYAPADVAAVVAATLGRPVDIAVLPETEWPRALAGANFSPSALAGFIELTQGLNSLLIDMESDPAAIARRGCIPLDRVIRRLAGAGDK